MKNLLSFILMICLLGCEEGFIMQRPPVSVGGRWRLYKIEKPSSTVSVLKDTIVLAIEPAFNGQYNNLVLTYINKKLVSSIKYTEMDDNKRKSYVIYTFVDGTKRKFDIVKGGDLVTSDFVKEIGSPADTVLYYYREIPWPNLW